MTGLIGKFEIRAGEQCLAECTRSKLSEVRNEKKKTSVPGSDYAATAV